MTVIDAAYWGHRATTTFGPGLAVAAAIWLLSRAIDPLVGRLVDHAVHRRTVAARRRALAAERREAAQRRGELRAETRAGHDQNALDTCNAIYQLPAREGENQ
ncbi:hypothetical protein [Streptomyces sp. NPDC055243]|uniref:hypothetical protein n=1 Tax=Streptomyces sp. NPDC055243 TaxID=3365720 RepID=UPI0037D17FF8